MIGWLYSRPVIFLSILVEQGKQITEESIIVGYSGSHSDNTYLGTSALSEAHFVFFYVVLEANAELYMCRAGPLLLRHIPTQNKSTSQVMNILWGNETA